MSKEVIVEEKKDEKKWNDKQLEAIGNPHEPSNNILVSAGAGSGKTAVLTERVIRLLNDGVNINELLVLTFTNAAAAEMKARIRKAIKKNVSLKDQLDLIDSAYITTFDSYALSLVKKYHYLLGISNNVKIVNEAALKLEKYKIIDEIMEEQYKEKEKGFVSLISRFCLKDDDKFKALIYELNDKFDLIINKEQYLSEYNSHLNDERANKIWNDYYNEIMKKVDVFRALYEEIEDTLESKEDEILFNKLRNEVELAITSNNFDDIASHINFNGNKVKGSKNINETFLTNKAKMTAIKNEIKEMIDCKSKNEIINAIKENFAFEKEIINLVIEINKRVNKLKYDNEMFEFMDIAKMAIKVLEENPSINEEIKESIHEIMLDEYQDTSDIQEALMSYISKKNIYMVGDIKQSIYRFRNANPKIFSDKYKKYKEDKTEGKVIDLMQNYRSRREVLDDINLLFNKIMNEEYGGVNYSKGHEFKFGNTKYDENIFTNQSNNLEIYNYKKEKDFNFSNEEIEAFIIGRDIKNKIENNYMVYDKDEKIQRELKYGDITILIDRKTSFDTYQKIFEYLQIPMSSYKNTNLTITNELLCFKNIYKLILKYSKNEFDTEFKHSFMSVARSFLFEYDDSYLFDIISNKDFYNNSIYESLKDIINNLECLSIIQISELILNKLDVFYKVNRCSGIEDITAIIHYISDLIGDLNTLGYDLEKVVEYFDSVIDKDFKIELPVRKNNMNSVKIMTIHASKGLEFNICYFSGFNKNFSDFDSKKKFIYDSEYGIIMPLIINNEKYTNVAKYLYKKKDSAEEISEKIRLLYVALSRAKEKMIIVGDFSKENENKKLSETKSFHDLIKYGENAISRYYKYIDLNDYNISNEYKYYKNIKQLNDEDCEKIINKEIKIENKEIKETSFSKKQLDLINEDTISILNKGNKLHSILEKIDFNSNDLNNYKLENDERRILEKFLKSDLLINANKGKIYKEYEFIYNDSNEIKHGFIDLMIIYDDYIDIIDYKLSNIEDDAYINQLTGYKNYINLITNKSVNLYLYSLFKGEYKKI